VNSLRDSLYSPTEGMIMFLIIDLFIPYIVINVLKYCDVINIITSCTVALQMRDERWYSHWN